MKPVNQELHDLAQNDGKLLDVIKALHQDWIEQVLANSAEAKLRRQSLTFVLDALAEHNAQWLEYYCESPIERTLVASMLLNYAANYPLRLIITPNFLHKVDPLDAFRSVCDDMKNFVSDERFASMPDFMKHIRECYDAGVITKETFRYMSSHWVFHHFFDLSSASICVFSPC